MPTKCLFQNANYALAQLAVSITSVISLWYRPCYKEILNHDNNTFAENLRQYKNSFFDSRAYTDFHLEHFLG